MTEPAAAFELHGVAFLRATGGMLHLLLAVVRDDVPIDDAEPLIIASHRPGADAASLDIELDGRLDSTVSGVIRQHATALVQWIEQAFDARGELDAQRLVGRAITFSAPASTFLSRVEE